MMDLGRKLYIRSLVNIASEPISFFWPMRNFVHHNPLHELERLDFREAIKEGEKFFKGKAFLDRKDYLDFMKKGLIEEKYLKKSIEKFLEGKETPISSKELLELIKNPHLRPYKNAFLQSTADEKIVNIIKDIFREDPHDILKCVIEEVGRRYLLTDLVELFFGDDINSVVNELVIKATLDFLDEGQSVIGMPGREKGFFKSWRELAKRNLKYVIKGGREFAELLERYEEPEEAIDDILKSYRLPEELWEGFITLELAQLKGFVGYIRWRSHNKQYYFQRKYPTDVVEFAAIRLIVEKGILDHRRKTYPFYPSYENFKEFINGEPDRAYLMYEYHSKGALGKYASLLPDYFSNPERIIEEYLNFKANAQAQNWAIFLRSWLGEKLDSMNEEEIKKVVELYKEFEREEGYIWLEALENSLIERLTQGILKSSYKKSSPKAQALFCIDVRSERYRRNLERIGNYETYGIAGFFGVPMAFVELHKGHEEFLCPVLIKPKNIVLEVPKKLDEHSESLTHIFEEILHDLKQNILTPYITVEAIGFLFGFDFIGKTFMPYPYSKLREKLLEPSEKVDYIIDKLSKEEIEKIISTVYKITIKKVLKHEYGIKEERITEELLEEILLMAIENSEFSKELEKFGFSEEAQKELVKKLKNIYKIDRGYKNLLYERLSKLGFSLEEQATLIAKALQMIGLKEFAPFVFVLGHGSKSDNNPYESALDCGACGGASGLYNAIIFTRMANNPQVRKLIKERFGIEIPENTYFIPGLHNTTTDEIYLYETQRLPEDVRERLEEIKEDFERASILTAVERYKELFEEQTAEGELRKIYKVLENAYDWSQVRPEWGLSGNYAFIIGRRELTKHLNLEGKVFLHSYDYRIDKKGFLLENILSGPMVVGQWINMEHYFSTTDNDVYGSGSKVYHNVVGRFGVVSGNFSDLRTGLPTQTVMKGTKPHHIPARLIVILEAPFEFGRNTVERVYIVRELIKNRWINFIIFDPERRKFYRYYEGKWREFKPEVSYEEA